MSNDKLARAGAEVPAELKEFLTADELSQMVDETRAGLNATLPRIKIVAGGAGLFQDPSDETSKQIEGIVIKRHAARAFWEKGKTEEENTPPTCSSKDGDVGSLPRDKSGAYGTCADCRWSKFGTAVDDEGVAGKGQACRLMDRMYLCNDGQDTPFVLTAPPSSLKEVAAYMTRLLVGNPKRLPIMVLTRFTLERHERGKRKWSTLKITKVRDLRKEEMERAFAMRGQFMPIIDAVAVTAADYGAPPASA